VNYTNFEIIDLLKDIKGGILKLLIPANYQELDFVEGFVWNG